MVVVDINSLVYRMPVWRADDGEHCDARDYDTWDAQVAVGNEYVHTRSPP